MKGWDPLFAYLKEGMLTCATRRVQGEFLYLEILDAFFDCAADARQILRKIAFRQRAS
jgi:hypothetical protein